ncbi:metallopeptidase TldD-related protein [Burkholderia gladioli pv. gladioli]|uniref:Modulator of DNA gyrase family protein n=1 Tax=Burkholderia gladioli TaxID=28095 RepID=A0A095HCC5_BURGA|nr:metallopeptidase TldD-related protein [Burkholderia gladioli]AJW97052.1 modulator of DNA gyrase family protein [Burkholderia gladioli]ASD79988.1 peptidase U62 [Burkholderia gladioli pv. gladioli]AWY54765.1 peptidase U62 [Burkholderia gladioli pv. gladioli]KGC11214.1 modulator of DNA gyrase family protein [Burkholderia gladioli]MDJ1164250.1 metallopeptidase TldD-related protein [Burkholderia gladioli pv. gladioli]
MQGAASPFHDGIVKMEDTASRAIGMARNAGADSVRVEVVEFEAKAATVRGGVSSEKNVRMASEISISVYRNGSRAATSSSDLSDEGLKRAVEAAVDIAKVTAPDMAAGLAQADEWATVVADLELYNRHDASLDEWMSVAARAEDAAFAHSPLIGTTNGASMHASAGVSLLATSGGFCRSSPWSAYSISCAPVAVGDNNKQIGFWNDAARSFADLDTPESIGIQAARRAIGSLDAQPVSTRNAAVLFEPSAVMSLIGELVSAASGDALYRTGSFLKDRLGAAIFPAHLNVREDPFVKRGMASRLYDGDGISGSRRWIVEEGTLQAYFLGLYAARRLNMAPTGNGAGAHNLEVISTMTTAADDFAAMLRKLRNGLLVTEMAGGGVNRLTGDFSRAAKGFWVENGEIRFPVAGITLASNLTSMFADLLAVGSDTITRGGVTTGSWLIGEMTIGGH